MSDDRKQVIRRHTDLEVYKRAFAAAMRIFELTKTFPKEERYSLTDQIRRSSRSVAANTAEAWRKRRYEGAWISKLGDSEAEAAETQTWLQFSVECGYLEKAVGVELYQEYDAILGMLVNMLTGLGTLENLRSALSVAPSLPLSVALSQVDARTGVTYYAREP
jgi:four helix bundle protein